MPPKIEGELKPKAPQQALIKDGKRNYESWAIANRKSYKMTAAQANEIDRRKKLIASGKMLYKMLMGGGYREFDAYKRDYGFDSYEAFKRLFLPDGFNCFSFNFFYEKMQAFLCSSFKSSVVL